MRVATLMGAFWLFVLALPAAAVELDQVLARHVPADGPGVVAAVFRDGREVYVGARGYASIELGVPMERRHVLRIGSMTKQFTAAAVLQLAEAGKLQLTDHLNKYVPDFPTHGHDVTLGSLLNHTSGLNNYTDDQQRFLTKLNDSATLDEVIREFHRDPMLSAPGEVVKYSNTGYVLLGKVIEVASGESYADYLTKHIFKKLGMNATYLEGRAVIPNKASGYSLAEQQTVTAGAIDMIWPYSAGGLVATVDDMAKWYFGLVSGKVVSLDSYRRMSSAGKLNNGEPVALGGMPYGFGLAELNINGRKVVAHNGGIHGFNSFALFDPQTATYVVALVNSDSAFDSSGIVRDLFVAEQGL